MIKSTISDQHQPVVAKSGAILANGILDAGGRNVVVSLDSKGGFMRMGSVVGLAICLQHWYWYPTMHFLSLSFTPTMIIGLNKDFDIPKNYTVKCNAPYSMFAYPKMEEKKEDKKELVATAVLSTTARAKAREARKEAKKAGGNLSDGVPLERVMSHISTASHMSIEDRNEVDKSDEPRKKEKEPIWYVLENPSRVIPAQVKFICENDGDDEQRYVPVGKKTTALSGIIMLDDKEPDKPAEVTKGKYIYRVLLLFLIC